MQTRLRIRHKSGFFNERVEGRFGVADSALDRELSETLLARFTELDFATPFGFEDLRGCYAAGGIGVED